MLWQKSPFDARCLAEAIPHRQCRLAQGPALSQWLSILQTCELNGKHLRAVPWTCFGFQGDWDAADASQEGGLGGAYGITSCCVQAARVLEAGNRSPAIPPAFLLQNAPSAEAGTYEETVFEHLCAETGHTLRWLLLGQC